MKNFLFTLVVMLVAIIDLAFVFGIMKLGNLIEASFPNNNTAIFTFCVFAVVSSAYMAVGSIVGAIMLCMKVEKHYC